MANSPNERNAGENLPPFEQALEQVQHIIDAIESGQVPLEQSLDQYAKGIRLIRHCRAVLDRAEQKIKQLTVDEQGNVVDSADVNEKE